MTDADQCDLDTLTAFLESDEEFQNDEKETQKDECSIDEITAFLESSDDEDWQGLDEVGSTKEAQNGSVPEQGKEMTLSPASHGVEMAIQSEDSVNKEDLGEENKENLGEESRNVNDTDCDEEENQSGEDEPNSHDAIKAEMAAMAERMKQLQDLLEKNTPKSKSYSNSTNKKGDKFSSKNVKPVESPSHNSQKMNMPPVAHSHNDRKRTCNDKSRSEMNKGHSSAKSVDKLDNTKIKSTPTKSPKTERRGEIQLESRRKEKLNGLDSFSPRMNKNSLVKSANSSPMSTNRTQLNCTRTEERGKKDKVLSVSPASSRSHIKSSRELSSSTSPRLQGMKSHFIEKDGINPFFNDKVEGAEVKVDSRTIFGDSDDSDWEDLAGEEKTKLNDQGRVIKKLLNQGEKKREAHIPKYDISVLKKPAVSTWAGVSSKPAQKSQHYPIMEVEKPGLNPETGTVSGKYKVKEEYMPKVARPAQDDRREFVQDPYCGIRIVNPRISMDSFKTKMDGRSLVKVSRLLSKSGVNDLQKDNWVTLGVVVHKTEPRQSANGKTYCIWKLSDLTNCDASVTFFLFGNVYKEHWKNELGVVIGLLNPSIMDKAEKSQSEVALTVNHPNQILIMGVSKDLGRCKGTTKAGSVCGNFINRTQGEYCTYHVQAAYRKSSSKRTELQAVTGRAPKAFEQKKKAASNSSAGCFFYGGQTFSTITPRTTNTKDKVTLKKLQVLEAGKEQGKLTTMSLHELKPEDTQTLQKLKEKDKQLLDLLAVPTVGSMNFVKHLVKKDKIEKDTDKEKPEVQSMSAKDLLLQHKTSIKQKQMAQKVSLNPLSAVPKLGKGFQMGQEISLDVAMKKVDAAATNEVAKKLAIAKIKMKGGITKEDPNAVRKKITSPENREKIKKRVAEDMDISMNDGEPVTEPPKKKSKLLGNLDLNSDELQKLLKAKSKHKGALEEAEAEHEEKYFSSLEKKEQMEEKMGSIMEVPVTVFICKQCNYKYFSLHDRCKQQNHLVKKISGVKRFFKCKQCKKRCISLDKMPTKPCKECGSSSFERVSMLKEKSGPKLESEELSIRGNEQKFVGALQGKTYLNV